MVHCAAVLNQTDWYTWASRQSGSSSVSLIALDGCQIFFEGSLIDIWMTFHVALTAISVETQTPHVSWCYNPCCSGWRDVIVAVRPTRDACPWSSEGTSWRRFGPGLSCSCWWRWHPHDVQSLNQTGGNPVDICFKAAVFLAVFRWFKIKIYFLWTCLSWLKSVCNSPYF